MKLVRVPLRISLVGGGSDIPAHYNEYGGGVVSFTINKYIYISAKRNTSLFPHKYRLVYSKVEECGDRSEIKHPIIRQLVDDYGIGSLDLDVMSDIPAGTGMGSSSAFTVGLHMALGYTGDKHRLAELACMTELEDLKEPIGKQDQYAAAFGGLNHIEFSKKGIRVSTIHLTHYQSLLFLDSLNLVYIGGSRSASEQLKGQTHTPNQMRILASECAYELARGYPEAVGPIIREGWEIKKSMSPNVSTPEIDNIIDIALKNGATGGKLLGAGGAGFVLLVCPPESKGAMRDALSHLNLTYIDDFQFDKEGAKVLYES